MLARLIIKLMGGGADWINNVDYYVPGTDTNRWIRFTDVGGVGEVDNYECWTDVLNDGLQRTFYTFRSQSKTTPDTIWSKSALFISVLGWDLIAPNESGSSKEWYERSLIEPSRIRYSFYTSDGKEISNVKGGYGVPIYNLTKNASNVKLIINR